MEKNGLTLHPLLTKPFVVYTLSALAFIASMLYVNSVIRHATGSAFLLFVVVITLPALYMMRQGGVNRWSPFLLGIVYLLTFDTFYYSNVFVTLFLPWLILILIYVLYTGLLIRSTDAHDYFSNLFALFYDPVDHLIRFFGQLRFDMDPNTVIVKKVATAIAITLPFIIVFLLLLMQADENYSRFVKGIFDFSVDFSLISTIKVLLLTALLLAVVLTALSVVPEPEAVSRPHRLDTLIVSIFLGSIAFLFLSFIAVQFQYFFGGIDHTTLSHSQYARKGFFELAGVMTLAATILLFVYRRLDDQPLVTLFLMVLGVEVMLIGFSSLHKMHLYQAAFGQTHLRYYVEWFTYFLIILLVIFIAYLALRRRYASFLNVVTVTSILALGIVSSLNVDRMIMQSHIRGEHSVDYAYLRSLSIDVLDAEGIQQLDPVKMFYRQYGLRTWMQQKRQLRSCASLYDYHLGYCRAIRSATFEALQAQANAYHTKMRAQAALRNSKSESKNSSAMSAASK